MVSRCCRLCSEDGDIMIPIFGKEGLHQNISLKINTRLQIFVNEEDFLPKLICITCCGKLRTYDDFVKKVQNTQTKLTKLLTSTSINYFQPRNETEEIGVKPEERDMTVQARLPANRLSRTLRGPLSKRKEAQKVPTPPRETNSSIDITAITVSENDKSSSEEDNSESDYDSDDSSASTNRDTYECASQKKNNVESGEDERISGDELKCVIRIKKRRKKRKSQFWFKRKSKRVKEAETIEDNSSAPQVVKNNAIEKPAAVPKIATAAKEAKTQKTKTNKGPNNQSVQQDAKKKLKPTTRDIDLQIGNSLNLEIKELTSRLQMSKSSTKNARILCMLPSQNRKGKSFFEDTRLDKGCQAEIVLGIRSDGPTGMILQRLPNSNGSKTLIMHPSKNK